MLDLAAQVRRTIQRHHLLRPGDRVVVGVSGGVDSLVLLHLLHHLEMDLKLHAATLDHGIRGAAGAADAEYVRQVATAWGIPVTVGQADVPTLAQRLRLGLEEAARRVRYTFLQRVAWDVGAARLAVAHHQNDQAETVLLHLIRGSGLKGLGGIAWTTPLSQERFLPEAPIRFDPPLGDHPPESRAWAVVIRPLLDTPRAALEAYAAEHGLRPRYDATNEDLNYLRNRVRREVLPLLEQLNPAICAALARTAAIARDDRALIEAVGEAAFGRVVRTLRPDRATLDRAVWDTLSQSEKRYVIRAVVERLRPGLRDLSLEHVQNAIEVADGGQTGAEAGLPGGLHVINGYEGIEIGGQDALIADVAVPLLEPGWASAPFSVSEGELLRVGEWSLEASRLPPESEEGSLPAEPRSAVLVLPHTARLIVRTRRRGDRFRPAGMGGHSQKLSDRFINLKIPAAWRDRLPLLEVDGEIAWFAAPSVENVQRCVAEPFVLRKARPADDQRIMIFRWRRS